MLADEFNAAVRRAGRVGCTGRLGRARRRRPRPRAAIGRPGRPRLGWRRRRAGLHRGIGIAWQTPDRAAGAPFDLVFDNEDAATPHNFTIKDSTGADVFKGEIFPGVATSDVPRCRHSRPGTYTFVCTVHPTMTGTLTVK